jgi:hypothetical protein
LIPSGSEFSGPRLKKSPHYASPAIGLHLLFVTLRLGCCRVDSCSRPVSNGRPGFGDFLNRDIWFRDFLNYSQRERLIPPRSSFFMNDTFTFIELSHNTFTLFIDDVLFSMLQNYLGIFLFCDRNFAHVHMCMVTSVVKTIKINGSAPLNCISKCHFRK